MHIEGLDENDNKILNLIKDNAKLSYSEIAKQLGISRVAVGNRIEAMEKKGIIRGYQTLICAQNATDSIIEFILDIEVNPQYFAEVMNDLGKEPFIRKIIILTGPCKVQASGFAPNQKELSKYVETLYYRMRGILSVKWYSVLATEKDIDGGVEYERREIPKDEGDSR